MCKVSANHLMVWHAIAQISYMPIYNISILSLVRTSGIVKFCSPFTEFLLTGVLSIKKALKGTKTDFVLMSVYCTLSIFMSMLHSNCNWSVLATF